MVPELGGSQISALLESVPGIASVLRSPVADAMVNMVRAGAGAGEFQLADARELVQYAVRRGLISADEGDQLLEEVTKAAKGRKGRGRGKTVKTAKPKSAKKTGRRKATSKKTARKAKTRAASRVRKTTTSKRTKRR
jgi:polyhydroxyalkanoate synthesis regulator phasin